MSKKFVLVEQVRPVHPAVRLALDYGMIW